MTIVLKPMTDAQWTFVTPNCPSALPQMNNESWLTYVLKPKDIRSSIILISFHLLYHQTSIHTSNTKSNRKALASLLQQVLVLLSD